MKRILFAVTSDLSYDQRMQRICASLGRAGYGVTLVGRVKKTSPPLDDRPYRQVRFRCFFSRGKLFYLEFNLRLLWRLLFAGFDIVCGIDLDTIVPCIIISKIRKKVCVYDAHDYFPEVTEVVNRPLVRRIWEAVERFTFRHVRCAYTVSGSIAKEFFRKYGKKAEVVRNVPVFENAPDVRKAEPYILFQGDVNPGRGMTALLDAMKDIPIPLQVAGKGDIFDGCVKKVQESGLTEKVRFLGYVKPGELRNVTASAFAGLNLFENAGLNNYYSLNNKFFQYIHAGIPQVAMDFPEYRALNEKYEVAVLLPGLSPAHIAGAAGKLCNDPSLYRRLAGNCLAAARDLCWQNEEKKLLEIYGRLDG